MISVMSLFAAAMLMTAFGCAGQTPDSSRSGPLDLLSIPEGQPRTCRLRELRPVAPRAANTVIRGDFRFGLPSALSGSWPREVSVLFDSVGHPRALTDYLNHAPLGSETIIALIRPDGHMTGKSIVITVDSVARADALARGDLKASLAAARPPVTRDLSPAEAARVRPLATWLWEHKCEREGK
jgi:hypothetical protein